LLADKPTSDAMIIAGAMLGKPVVVGAPASDVRLLADGSAATVKRASLADYRAVHFATHCLADVDVKGVAEPSLTIPSAMQRPNKRNASGKLIYVDNSGRLNARRAGMTYSGPGIFVLRCSCRRTAC
jgi:hypothetical protein